MSIFDFEYRGVDVRVNDKGDLYALMRIRGAGLLIARYPQATREEGLAVVITRAKAEIDEYLVELRR